MIVSLRALVILCFFFFFFNDSATTEIYTLSLHDALPHLVRVCGPFYPRPSCSQTSRTASTNEPARSRSEEHTSELQSQSNLVCRLLLEKKKKRARARRQQIKTERGSSR